MKKFTRQDIRHWWNLLGHCERSEAIQSGLPRHSRRSFLAMTNGFTLAEVLITLAIIGIVAALTIPTLVANYQKKQWVSGLQKAISNTSQAFKLILADEGVDNLSQTSVFQAINDNDDANSMSGNQSAFVAELNKYMKISKACVNPNGYDPEPDCTSPVYKDLLGDDADGLYTKYGRVKLYMNDGMVYFIRAYKNAEPWNDNINVIAKIDVDINGDNGPNILGRDFFSFILLDNGNILLPGSKVWEDDADNALHWSHEESKDLCGNPFGNPGEYCAARVFEQGWKMDY